MNAQQMYRFSLCEGVMSPEHEYPVQLLYLYQRTDSFYAGSCTLYSAGSPIVIFVYHSVAVMIFNP